MRGILGIDPGWGVTAVRVALAAVFIHAGYRKVFVSGVAAIAGGFEKYALPAPAVLASLAAYGKLVGGIALLIGLFARWLGLFYTAEFIVAFVWVKLRLLGFAEGRIEMLLLAGAILLVLAGPGRAAVDRLWLEKA